MSIARWLVAGVLVVSLTPRVEADPQPGRAPKVVDSEGKVVGVAFDANANYCCPPPVRVLRRDVGKTVGVLAFSDRIDGDHPNGEPAAFYFESADCSGTRYLFEGARGLIHPTLRISRLDGSPVGGAVYYQGDPVATYTILGSAYGPFSASNCTASGGTILPEDLCCFSSVSFPLDVGPATSIDLSRFKPPFRLK